MFEPIIHARDPSYMCSVFGSKASVHNRRFCCSASLGQLPDIMIDARAGLAIPEALPCGRRVATSASWPCPAPPLRALLVISNARTRAPARTAHDDFPKNFLGNAAYATMRMGCAVAHCAQFPSSTRRKIKKSSFGGS